MKANRVKELLEVMGTGDVMAAFEEFYADHVTMQENANPPTVGKDANREREKAFFSTIAEIHGGEIHSVIENGSDCVVASTFEFTTTDGTRIRQDQIALQTWEDGKIVRERFYYDPTSLVLETANAS